MLIYQVQSGRLDASQFQRHAGRLLAAAASFRACCDALAACLESNAPIGAALWALEQLHAHYAALGEAAAARPAELWAERGTLAFSAWFSLMFAAAARLRKMYRVLPAALARDQPAAAQQAAACFERLPDWDLQLLGRMEPQAEAQRRDPMAVLRESLLS